MTKRFTHPSFCWFATCIKCLFTSTELGTDLNQRLGSSASYFVPDETASANYPTLTIPRHSTCCFSTLRGGVGWCLLPKQLHFLGWLLRFVKQHETLTWKTLFGQNLRIYIFCDCDCWWVEENDIVVKVFFQVFQCFWLLVSRCGYGSFFKCYLVLAAAAAAAADSWVARSSTTPEGDSFCRRSYISAIWCLFQCIVCHKSIASNVSFEHTFWIICCRSVGTVWHCGKTR